MAPKKKRREIPWATQPVVKTFETDFGRLRTVAGPKTKKASAQIAKIFVLDDGGGLIKTHKHCRVTIGQAKDRDTVIKWYRKYHDEETIEAAAAARKDQTRAAMEAAAAASEEMGLRGGRVAQQKSAAPSTALLKRAQVNALSRQRSAALRAYYASRAKVVYDRSNGGTVIIERLGGGSAGRLSCVSELGAYKVRRHPLLGKRFEKLTPATDEIEDADDVMDAVVDAAPRHRQVRLRLGGSLVTKDDDGADLPLLACECALGGSRDTCDEDGARDVDGVAATPALEAVDEASDDEAAAPEDEDEAEADDASAPTGDTWRPAFDFAAAPTWYYYCAEGITHGPFPAHQMVHWAEKGELRPDLLVARDAGGSPLDGCFVELQSLCSDPASSAEADVEGAAPVPTDDATPAPAATAPETLAVSEVDMLDADSAEADAVKAQVDEFLRQWDTGEITRTVHSLVRAFSRGDRGRFDEDVLDAALERFGEGTDGLRTGEGGKYERLAAKLADRPVIMNAPPPGLRTTRPEVLFRDMPSVDPSYFLNAGGDFNFNDYEQRATPAAWAERLQYRYFRQKMEPFFLCGCLCLSLFSYIWTSKLTAFLITLAWGCPYLSNGHVVGLNRLVVEDLLDAHVLALLGDPSKPRASGSRLRTLLGRTTDAWTHHDAIVRIPPELNRRQPRLSDEDTLLGEVRCGASGMNGQLKITCVAWCSVLACYMVVLLECNRRFPRALHKPSARQATEWRAAARALGAAKTDSDRNAAHAANPVKYDPKTRHGFVQTKLDWKALARFCDYQIPKMEAFIKELDACVEEIAWRSQIPVDAVTEEMLEDALDALEEDDAVPDVGGLSAGFDSGMRRRLKAFVVELREKRKEMPDPCAMWDPSGGDLGNGTWPAARVNAADKQYTLEAVQAA